MFAVLLAKFSSLKQKLCSLKGQVVTGWTNKDEVLIIPVKYLYTSLWAVKIIFMQFLILLQPCGESFPKDTPAFHCFYFSNRFICNFEKGLLPPPPPPQDSSTWMLGQTNALEGYPSCFPDQEHSNPHCSEICWGLALVYLNSQQLSVEQQAELSHIKG